MTAPVGPAIRSAGRGSGRRCSRSRRGTRRSRPPTAPPPASSPPTTTRARTPRCYSDDYECDYTTLNLPNRDAQVTKTIGPGASGWTDWKEALWTLNYLQVMHNVKEAAVETVADSGLAEVGVPGNAVTGNILPGTYLGSSNVEGFQAGNFIQILDNQAAAVAAPADHHRRRGARRVRQPRRRARLQPDVERAALVPGRRSASPRPPTPAASRGRAATRSPRPTATCSIWPACSAPTPASTR